MIEVHETCQISAFQKELVSYLTCNPNYQSQTIIPRESIISTRRLQDIENDLIATLFLVGVGKAPTCHSASSELPIGHRNGVCIALCDDTELIR